MKYQFLPHTADIMFQAFGNTLEKCFENSVYAFVDIITKNKVKPLIKKEFKIKSIDKESLLLNFLEEFLFLLDTENFICSKIEELKILGIAKKKNNKVFYNYELKVKCYGDNINNYQKEGQIKAITYNNMFIKRERINDKDFYTCQIVVDV
jgi:SHS2 domain-containing protein